ncbi:NirD/YgiW/YdeI family stress tolerance protein [Achromobacter xylosoxidans]
MLSKTIIGGVLLIASHGALAQYGGPTAAKHLTVSQLLASAPDDAHVVLRGRLVQKLSNDVFLLDDGSGQVRVEIDAHLFPRGVTVDATTEVEVEGEFDRELIGPSEVDVSVLRIMAPNQGRPAE